MTIKRSFWWGKLSGLLAGGIGGASGLSLSIFADAVWNGRLLTETDWLWQMIFYGIAALFVGTLVGAILGTLLGVLIAWTNLDEIAVTIWVITWMVVGLLISLVPHELYSLLSPVVWVLVGGVVGRYCGQFFLNGVRANRKKTAVSTPANSA